MSIEYHHIHRVTPSSCWSEGVLVFDIKSPFVFIQMKDHDHKFRWSLVHDHGFYRVHFFFHQSSINLKNNFFFWSTWVFLQDWWTFPFQKNIKKKTVSVFDGYVIHLFDIRFMDHLNIIDGGVMMKISFLISDVQQNARKFFICQWRCSFYLMFGRWEWYEESFFILLLLPCLLLPFRNHTCNFKRSMKNVTCFASKFVTSLVLRFSFALNVYVFFNLFNQ